MLGLDIRHQFLACTFAHLHVCVPSPPCPLSQDEASALASSLEHFADKPSVLEALGTKKGHLKEFDMHHHILKGVNHVKPTNILPVLLHGRLPGGRVQECAERTE